MLYTHIGIEAHITFLAHLRALSCLSADGLAILLFSFNLK